MENQNKENLDNTNECEKACKELKEIVVNIYNKVLEFLKKWYIILIIILGLIVLVGSFMIYYNKYSNFIFLKNTNDIIIPNTIDISNTNNVIEKLGQAGDYLGGTLNPIFAFLSFCLLLITIKLQSKELSNSTKELAKSSTALTEQSKSLQLQNFENTFFNMLNLYLKLKDRLNQNPPEVANIEYRVDNIKYVFNAKKNEEKIKTRQEGIPRLSYILFLFLNESNRFPKEFRNTSIDKIKEEIKLKYKKNQLNDTKNLYIYFTNIYGKYLNHLMRTTYHIINFIDTNNSIKDKKFYVNLFRSQIDIMETSLIFYNAISKYGENMLPLLIKYEFFEHLVYNDFICRPTLKLYIKKTKQLDKNYPINKAFGKHNQYKELLKKLEKEETKSSSQEPQ